ncbi:hypothetical protein WJX75_001843 [Coccomyxa subellipsoidea]|uniref:Selenoprotein F n=1 Tax=Coccomyxa subellipsoidea TaxID=248742 RepID=A0ABR2YUU4_9CHLO
MRSARRSEITGVKAIAFLSLVLNILLPVSAASNIESETDCASLGFTGLQPCSACDTLRSYLGDHELVDDCQRCCTPESDLGSGKFLSAVLEVCKHRLREFPTVEHFVNDKAEDFDSLEVRYRFGSSPRLILNGENGKKETLRIDKWKTELIEEFLRDKLPANTAEL